MNENDQLTKELKLHFESKENHDASIPLKPYLQALQGLEKAINILCELNSSDFLNSSKPFPGLLTSIKAQDKGSLQIAVDFRLPMITLFNYDDIKKAVDQLLLFPSLMNGINESQTTQLVNMLSQNRLTSEKLFQAWNMIIPQRKSNLALEISENNHENKKIILEEQDRMKLEWLQDKMFESSSTNKTITVSVSSLSFKNNKVKLRYQVGEYKKEFSVDYSIEDEDFFIENRRELIQITGVIEYNEALMPTEVLSMYKYHAIDYEPLELANFTFQSRTFEFIQGPKKFNVKLDDSKQYYAVEDPQLNVYVYATQRSELIKEITESLYADWVEIASAEDNELDASAIALKRYLLSVLREKSCL
ncbi:hypothetical protein LLG10_06280 [bacterium]|nr:hypothetical protein [bacterium]